MTDHPAKPGRLRSAIRTASHHETQHYKGAAPVPLKQLQSRVRRRFLGNRQGNAFGSLSLGFQSGTLQDDGTKAVNLETLKPYGY
jgi:hypothetical protein